MANPSPKVSGKLCVGRLRSGDQAALESIVHDPVGIFKGSYIGSMPAKLPANRDEHAEFVATLLRSMKALQTPAKVTFCIFLCFFIFFFGNFV